MASVDRGVVCGWVYRWFRAIEFLDRSVGELPYDQAEGCAALYVVALRDLLRAVDLAKQHEPAAVDQALQAFDHQVPAVKNMRNVLEHFDEYEAGTGRQQTEGVIGTFEFNFDYRGRRIQVATGYTIDLDAATPAALELANSVLSAVDPVLSSTDSP